MLFRRIRPKTVGRSVAFLGDDQQITGSIEGQIHRTQWIFSHDFGLGRLRRTSVARLPIVWSALENRLFKIFPVVDNRTSRRTPAIHLFPISGIRFAAIETIDASSNAILSPTLPGTA